MGRTIDEELLPQLSQLYQSRTRSTRVQFSVERNFERNPCGGQGSVYLDAFLSALHNVRFQILRESDCERSREHLIKKARMRRLPEIENKHRK
jgi:hypothetical protein